MEKVSDIYTASNIEQILLRLSPDQLRKAVDFLVSLEIETEATDELLSIPDFETDFQEALEEATRGDVVSFKSIRRYV